MALMRTIVNPPHDYLEPQWDIQDRVHNWRNYITDEVIAMWPDFTPEQRAALARQADEIAMAEDWD